MELEDGQKIGIYLPGCHFGAPLHVFLEVNNNPEQSETQLFSVCEVVDVEA